ncbi:MAG: hypothetical protein ACI4JQ_09205 [Ruminococcus sp.]
MEIFTVSFFGHRNVSQVSLIEKRLEAVIQRLLAEKEYVEFLVGRSGEFDQLASSAVRRAKRTLWDDNSALVLVLPYPTAEYQKNEDSFHRYYDEIEICQNSAAAHFKSAMQIRNWEMVDRSHLVVCCIEHDSGGAYQTVQYARKQQKRIVNLADLSTK